MNQTVIRATAGALGDSFGKNLVGLTVLTPAEGGWAGGLAVITAYLPDEAAPEIPFWVRDISSGKEIGLFADEQLGLFVDADSSYAVATAMTLADVCRQMLSDAMRGTLPDAALKQRAVLALAAAGFVMPQLGIEVAA